MDEQRPKRPRMKAELDVERGDRRGKEPDKARRFRCDDELWELFCLTCEAREENASMAIRRGMRGFIRRHADILREYLAEHEELDRRSHDELAQRRAADERDRAGEPDRRRHRSLD